jgi:hypothetical protein
MWASVDQNGTLVRSKGVASALKIATGQYQVVFNQDVTGCGYLASVGGPGNAPTTGEATVSQRVNIAAGVHVVTSASAGGLSDRPFFVAAFC